MRAKNLRRWAAIHKWSALISGGFLLLLCLTGLPLIFADELNHWLAPRDTAATALAADARHASLDGMVATSHRLYPDQIIASVTADDAESQVLISMLPSWDRMRDRGAVHFIRFDARSGRMLDQARGEGEGQQPLVDFLLQLHSRLFGGVLGGFLLGLVALLVLSAVVSGLIVYGPFARNVEFGTIRNSVPPRLKWFDLHRLLGVVTFAWLLVVAGTGFMNEMSLPLFAIWERLDVRQALAPWRDMAALPQSELGSVQAAVDATRQALPHDVVLNVIYPGMPFGSPRHYIVMARGDRPLTAQLFTPVVVDAQTAKVTIVGEMPWYLKTLGLSRPLHFGNYGGLPLKIIWALLDLVTIAILGTGIYLWLSGRRRSPRTQPPRVEAVGGGADHPIS